MPDILIRGMEIPKSCFICPFCVPAADEENGEMCAVTGRLFGFSSQSERDESCTLVELPSHGDLVDRDALLARYDAEHVGAPGRAREIIEQAPIVIPAEREGE